MTLLAGVISCEHPGNIQIAVGKVNCASILLLLPQIKEKISFDIAAVRTLRKVVTNKGYFHLIKNSFQSIILDLSKLNKVYFNIILSYTSNELI